MNSSVLLHNRVPANDVGSEKAVKAAKSGLLHDNVAHRLREMILTGELAPGIRLNERVLCAVLQVSRTPLREAFRVLAVERLVVLLPNRGATVVALSAADVHHLFEVMIGLEGMSGALAAERITDAQLDEIRALHFEMLAAHARRDLAAYYRLNRQIHEAISLAAANPALAETYQSVNIRIEHLRFRSNFNRAKWDAAVDEHSQIIAALSTRDSAEVRRLLEIHLSNKREAVLATFPNPEARD